LENWVVRDGSGRWRITLAFGLIHGFGFAGALQDIGVPEGRAPAALALFNLGVEFGQLAVLAGVLPIVFWLRRRPQRWLISARIVNTVLVALGLGWTVQRLVQERPTLVSASSGQRQELMPARAPDSVLASVYPHDPPRSTAAQRLCDLFARLPRERRAACASAAPGITLERECARVLSTSLASGALRVVASAADSCERDMLERYGSCEFVGAAELPAIATCLTCSGAGTFDLGVCSAPKHDGEGCGRSLDLLAAYLPHRDIDHPECAGKCLQGRCRGAALPH
jgi:hypothetical protein